MGNLARSYDGLRYSYRRHRQADGTYLENTQLEPDILVLNNPETVVKGEDTQLKTAVEELLKEIAAKGNQW